MVYSFAVIDAQSFEVVKTAGTLISTTMGGRSAANDFTRSSPGVNGETQDGGGDFFTIELPGEFLKFRRSEVDIPVTADDDALEVFLRDMVKGQSGAGDASFAEQEAQTALLQDLLDELALKADLTETQPVSLPTPTGLTSAYSVTSTSGTISTCFSWSVTNVGSANGTLAGAVFKPGQTVSASADGVRYNTVTGLAYDATGTSFAIFTLS